MPATAAVRTRAQKCPFKDRGFGAGHQRIERIDCVSTVNCFVRPSNCGRIKCKVPRRWKARLPCACNKQGSIPGWASLNCVQCKQTCVSSSLASLVASPQSLSMRLSLQMHALCHNAQEEQHTDTHQGHHWSPAWLLKLVYRNALHGLCSVWRVQLHECFYFLPCLRR
jgi:hypothetical protein